MKKKDVIKWYQKLHHVYDKPGSQASIEISGKIWVLGYASYCTLHSVIRQPGHGYNNSLILQALELPSWASGAI